MTVGLRALHEDRHLVTFSAAGVSTKTVLRGLEYGLSGCLQDDTGHRWSRVKDWVEPVEAERLVREGTRFVVQHCRTPPIAERPERFKKDVRAHMLTSAAADAYADKLTVPTVMVGELWNSTVAGDLLLFVEQGPQRRSAEELQDDW